jgi:hypothetical protein
VLRLLASRALSGCTKRDNQNVTITSTNKMPTGNQGNERAIKISEF